LCSHGLPSSVASESLNLSAQSGRGLEAHFCGCAHSASLSAGVGISGLLRPVLCVIAAHARRRSVSDSECIV
jgi:hypothetical protein